jgi:hypothetical protein
MSHEYLSGSTYFWCVALGLEGSEKGLFGTKNLDSGGGVFGQVRQ